MLLSSYIMAGERPPVTEATMDERQRLSWSTQLLCKTVNLATNLVTSSLFATHYQGMKFVVYLSAADCRLRKIAFIPLTLMLSTALGNYVLGNGVAVQPVAVGTAHYTRYSVE